MLNRKTLGILAMSVSLSLFPSLSAAESGFLVAPGRLQIDADQLKTHSFIVTNIGNNPIRLSIEPIYLAIDDPTMNAGKHLTSGVDENENIVDKVRVSPQRLSLNPGQRRDVRVQIRPLTDKEPGDYRAHLLVKMNENAYTMKQNAGEGDGIGFGLDIKMETAVALYGRKGEPVVDMDMACKTLPNGMTRISKTNPTAWRFEGQLIADSMKAIPVVVLRESVRTTVLDLPPEVNASEFRMNNPEGEMVAKAVCTDL